MTRKELMKIIHPDKVSYAFAGGVSGCPGDYGLGPDVMDWHCVSDCKKCWNKQCSDEQLSKYIRKTSERSPSDIFAELCCYVDNKVKKVETRLDNLEKHITCKKNISEMDSKLPFIYKGLLSAGYSEEEAFEIIINTIGKEKS